MEVDGGPARRTRYDDAAGDPIVNDPAAASDAEVPRTDDRAELGELWVSKSGGTAYLIHPANHPVPEA